MNTEKLYKYRIFNVSQAKYEHGSFSNLESLTYDFFFITSKSLDQFQIHKFVVTEVILIES